MQVLTIHRKCRLAMDLVLYVLPKIFGDSPAWLFGSLMQFFRVTNCCYSPSKFLSGFTLEAVLACLNIQPSQQISVSLPSGSSLWCACCSPSLSSRRWESFRGSLEPRVPNRQTSCCWDFLMQFISFIPGEQRLTHPKGEPSERMAMSSRPAAWRSILLPFVVQFRKPSLAFWPIHRSRRTLICLRSFWPRRHVWIVQLLDRSLAMTSRDEPFFG